MPKWFVYWAKRVVRADTRAEATGIRMQGRIGRIE
jgi:hypothetical protein